jgi:biopolymer transport protein ExbD
MKRFSKSHHTSLHEINITPLLDLAFVLLVIFVITTTPLVQDKHLELPAAASRPKDPPRKPNYVSVDAQGNFFLNMKPVDLNGLLQQLIELRVAALKDEQKQDVSIIVRGDSQIPYQYIRAVLEVLRQANIVKVSLATDSENSARN